MLKIENNSVLLLLRVNDFEEYSFADQHIKSLKKNGSIWMLKAGRNLTEKAVQTILKTGVVILKEQKRSGNRFFLAETENILQGKRTESMVFPEYYLELEESGIILTGTWIQIKNLKEIDKDSLNHIIVNNSKEKVLDVITKTRAPYLYCMCCSDLCV